MNTTLVVDGDASRARIEAAFDDIRKKAKPQDAFVFSYAGHGVMSEADPAPPAELYLPLVDVKQLYGDNEELARAGMSSSRLRELATLVPAQKQLLVMDACQSGGAVESFSFRGAAEEKAMAQLARSAGVVVLAASQSEQLAAEVKQLGHGVFTYALLAGLQGAADLGHDGKITVKELEAYLNDEVPALTKKYRGTAQYPNSFAQGQDFPLALP